MIIFLVAPLAASVILIAGILHMATYVGPNLRQFDPETAIESRLFGLALLVLVGFYLPTQWITVSRDKERIGKQTDYA